MQTLLASTLRHVCRAALLAVLVGSVVVQGATPPRPKAEYEIKAVFLYNFTRFVEWPASSPDQPAKPFVIGVLGEDPFGRWLDEVVRGEAAANRALVVRRVADVEEAETCDAVFISRSETDRLKEILDRLEKRPILTVSDIPDFAERGGMVGLVTENHKVRLQINVDASKAANLTISAKLLRPAQIVTSRKTSKFDTYDFYLPTGLLARSGRRLRPVDVSRDEAHDTAGMN